MCTCPRHPEDVPVYKKNELSRSRLSNVGALQTDRHTQTDVTERTTTPHSRVLRTVLKRNSNYTLRYLTRSVTVIR